MVEAIEKSQVDSNESDFKQVKSHLFQKHLSTVFVVVGIVSFTLGAIVNYYTIKRIRNGQ